MIFRKNSGEQGEQYSPKKPEEEPPDEFIEACEAYLNGEISPKYRDNSGGTNMDDIIDEGLETLPGKILGT